MHIMLFVHNIFFVLIPNIHFLENFYPRISYEEALKKCLTCFPHVQNGTAAITPHLLHSYSRASVVWKNHSPGDAQEQ